MHHLAELEKDGKRHWKEAKLSAQYHSKKAISTVAIHLVEVKKLQVRFTTATWDFWPFKCHLKRSPVGALDHSQKWNPAAFAEPPGEALVR